ncbi:MAG: hypothetical protein GF355_03175, partial [Candidatus Eisenbacteria bacterium]|nr:hypothetical protein [Candidatus Latescibacterota bacterium]MBD3334495.1 hypothetical protein [Candidatus Eisenbacteria bacterium]
MSAVAKHCLLLALLLSAGMRSASAEDAVPQWRKDVEKVLAGTGPERIRAIQRLARCTNPSALPHLARLHGEVETPHDALLLTAVERLAHDCPLAELVKLAGDRSLAGDEVREALLRVGLKRGGARELKAGIAGPDGARLATALARTGRYDACQTLLGELEHASPEKSALIVAALSEMHGFSGLIVPRLRQRCGAEGGIEHESMLAAAAKLQCEESVEWLVDEAMHGDARALKAVLSPGDRPDVFLRLVDRLPESLEVLRGLSGQDHGVSGARWRQ